MNVFTDLHHADLYFSLKRLFEDRLGWRLYRPIGEQWFTEGYWKIAEPYGNAPDTIRQFLAIERTEAPYDQYSRLNAKNATVGDGTYRVHDPTHDYWHRAVTLEQFKAMRFGLIVSTLPCHDAPFERLSRLYQYGAPVVSQMGNWQQSTTLRHVLHTCPYMPTAGQNALYYHQEVDAELLKRTPPPTVGRKRIYSMVNLLPAKEAYDAAREALPEVEFRAYGAACPDGSLRGCAEIAPKIAECHLGWHIKPFDGFSHTAMAWMASGRAVATRMADVAQFGWDAPRLFVPGDTCIPVDDFDPAAIRRALEPEENLRMSENAARRFREVCDYDAEETRIRKWLEAVL